VPLIINKFSIGDRINCHMVPSKRKAKGGTRNSTFMPVKLFEFILSIRILIYNLGEGDRRLNFLKEIEMYKK
jgi:hypothetical protein